MNNEIMKIIKALNFNLTSENIYEKDIDGYKITINTDKNTIDYGNKIICENVSLGYLKRKKDLIILECVIRLLKKGYSPENIMLDGKENCPDIMIGAICLYCEDKESYEKDSKDFNKGNYSILYTSCVENGKVEYKNIVVFEEERYRKGYFEDDVPTFVVSPSDKI